MWTDLAEMHDEVNRVLDAALDHCHFTVAEELQRESLSNVTGLLARLEAFRKLAQARTDEPKSNAAYTSSRCVEGVASYFSMWIGLKESRFSDAWRALVDAQQNIRCALELAPNELCQRLDRFLLGVERVLFPPQLFNSDAPQYAKATCSICGEVYGECDHLAGRLYMGEKCSAIVEELTGVDHIAIVRRPADKALRIPALTDGDKKRCALTLRVIGPNDGVIEDVPLIRFQVPDRHVIYKFGTDET